MIWRAGTRIPIIFTVSVQLSGESHIPMCFMSLCVVACVLFVSDGVDRVPTNYNVPSCVWGLGGGNRGW